MIVSSKRVPSWTVYHPSPSGLPEIDYKLNIAPSGSGLQLSIGSHKMEIFKSMLCTVCQYYLLKYIYLMQHQPVKLLWLVEIILTMALMHYPIINGMIVVLKWLKVYIFTVVVQWRLSSPLKVLIQVVFIQLLVYFPCKCNEWAINLSNVKLWL